VNDRRGLSIAGNLGLEGGKIRELLFVAEEM
jgi:hypothetical protein